MRLNHGIVYELTLEELSLSDTYEETLIPIEVPLQSNKWYGLTAPKYNRLKTGCKNRFKMIK
jgi:hypothetical protein